MMVSFMIIIAPNLATETDADPTEPDDGFIDEPGFAEDSLDLLGKVIILDPGHGLSSTNVYAGYDEQVTMLKLAYKIKPLLEAQGATVLMARDSPPTVPLTVRGARVNLWALQALKNARLQESWELDNIAEDLIELDRLIDIMQGIVDTWGAGSSTYMNNPFSSTRGIHPDLAKVFALQNDPVIRNNFLVISLHTNATGTPINPSVNGADVFYISNSNDRTSVYYDGYSYEEQSKYFGGILLDQIESIGIRKRRVSAANYFMIREHNLPGVLTENGFHTGDSDRAKLMNDDFLDDLAVAYLYAISDYFNGLLSMPVYPQTPTSLYYDVSPNAWYYNAVELVSQLGLFSGTGPNTFSPSVSMTRAMFVMVLSNLADADVSVYTESPYADVPIDSWYGKVVAWATDVGILEADDDLFEPGRDISREEMALLIYRYALLLADTIPDVDPDEIFDDDEDISDWAREAVYATRALGIMQGDNNRFYPKADAIRAEVAQLFCNVVAALFFEPQENTDM